MSKKKTRKNKKEPHYGFLISWDNEAKSEPHVKREKKNGSPRSSASSRHGKKADSLAQAEAELDVKKDIIRSLAIISLVLILELVVYLAWIKFIK